MNTMLATQSIKIHQIIIIVLTVCYGLLFCALCSAQDDQSSNVFVNDLYLYQFEPPKGLVAKDSNNDGVRIELYKNGKIAMIITVIKPNPEGMVATDRGMTLSDDVTMKERIVIDLSQSCKPLVGVSDSDLMETIDWSFPIVGGEKAVQANGSSLEQCSHYRFPLTMVRKGKMQFRFSNIDLKIEEFERILTSFEFFEIKKLDTSELGGE